MISYSTRITQLLFIILSLISSTVSAQLFNLSGKVTDRNDLPLPGALVKLHPIETVNVTGYEGGFEFRDLQTGRFVLEVIFTGFERYTETVYLEKDTTVNIQVTERTLTLEEVVITDNYSQRRKNEESLQVEVISEELIRRKMGGSLMQTLERFAGINAIEIGSGQSKPVIRGMAFNRVAVAENGIKHEGQQWGADHGLEVDQFAYDRIEIIKGPGSLIYGSDAIGGVINLKQADIPFRNTFGGKVLLTGKSNNNLAGISGQFYGRKEHLFLKLRGTLVDYADFRVPTDSIDIYSYRAGLHKNRLRNTAGKEQNIHVNAGYIRESFTGRLNVSHVYTKQGFFANTHGLEPRRVDNELHDKSDRDILMPFQEVSHLKIAGGGTVHGNKFSLRTDIAYQLNNRNEWSTYTRHGYMPPANSVPTDFPAELERAFNLHVWSGNAEARIKRDENLDLIMGISSDYHRNSIDGRGFIIPAYNKFNAGSFLVLKLKPSVRHQLQAGLRYDNGNLNIRPYHDWYPTPTETESGVADSLLQRAPALNRSFTNFSWSIGWNYTAANLSLKTNIGKSFRIPIAKELAANGVNYHRFSFEIGNPDLEPETAYQIDAGLEYDNGQLAFSISPFINYFTNYIFLDPGYEHDRLYGNGNQIFRYTQNKVWQYGGELHAHYNLTSALKAGMNLNYLWSELLTGNKKGFTLPFSTPASAVLNISYEPQSFPLLKHPYLSLDIQGTASQNRIVPPEVTTPGYVLLHAAAGMETNLGNHPLSIYLQLHNLLNKKYYNHTSYYRLINIPGPSRNVTLGLQLSF